MIEFIYFFICLAGILLYLIKSLILGNKEQDRQREKQENAARNARQTAEMEVQLHLSKLRAKRNDSLLDQQMCDFRRKLQELKDTIDDPEEYQRQYDELLNTHPFMNPGRKH